MPVDCEIECLFYGSINSFVIFSNEDYQTYHVQHIIITLSISNLMGFHKRLSHRTMYEMDIARVGNTMCSEVNQVQLSFSSIFDRSIIIRPNTSYCWEINISFYMLILVSYLESLEFILFCCVYELPPIRVKTKKSG